MSTQSRIGMVNEDGKVISIYCHWCGHPHDNGRILLKHYTDPAKVKALISLGGISSLGKELEPKSEYALSPRCYLKGDVKDWKFVRKMVKHSFDTPQDGVTVAYLRDHGPLDVHCKSRTDKSVKAFLRGEIEGFGYLFKDGKWFVIDEPPYIFFEGNRVVIDEPHPEKRKLVLLTKKYIDSCVY